jgi:hypothetical protein
VGTHDIIAVLGLARMGASRGETRKSQSARSAAVGKPGYGGLFKILYVHYQRQGLPLGPSDMFFQDQILLTYRPI